MRAIIATVRREWLQLSRDRGGLVVLFAMPLVLVLVISLVQDNVMSATGQSGNVFPVCLVDEDGGAVAADLAERLDAEDAFALVRESDGEPFSADDARGLVASGVYRFGVRIPAGTTEAVDRRTREAATAALDPETDPPTGEPVAIELWFDPLTQGSLRASVENAVARLALAAEFERQQAIMREELPDALGEAFADRLRTAGADPRMIAGMEPLDFAWRPELTLSVATADSGVVIPSAAQQNVPGWTLFGMFFIVVPLAGSLIREREQHTLQRLMVMSFSPGALILAKTLAYLAVCVVQCVLMLLVGMYALPLFGTTALELGPTPHLLLPVAGCAALAATTYGVLVGCWFRANDQASMFGAVSVVVAAALGGIMIPAYIMPPAMQTVSAFSPLAWAHQGFMAVFLREATVADLAPRCGLLLAFAAACLVGGRLGLTRAAG